MDSLDYKFEYQWGGEDTVFTKMRRWADKQNPIIRHLAHGFIEWLWQQWIDGRVEIEMNSVDRQAEVIVTEWEKQDKPVVKYETSEVEGLDIISISTNNK